MPASNIPDNPGDVVTARFRDFKRLTGVPERTARNLDAAGEIQTVLLGRVRLVVMQSYRDYLERLKKRQSGPDAGGYPNRPPAPTRRAEREHGPVAKHGSAVDDAGKCGGNPGKTDNRRRGELRRAGNLAGSRLP